MAEYTYTKLENKVRVNLISNKKDVAWYVMSDGTWKNVYGCQTSKPSKSVIKESLKLF